MTAKVIPLGETVSQRLRLGLEMRPYQDEGVRAIVKRFNGRALLADQMGLGKTVQAIACMAAYRNWPALVICPASLRLNWRNEIQAWLPNHIDPLEICVIKTGKCKLFGKVVICSYEMAAKRAAELLRFKFGIVAVDESQYIKNKDAKRTKEIVPLCQQIPRVVLMSGTPILNRPIELWTQLRALNIGKGADAICQMKFWDYARRYCNLKRGRFGWDFKGASNIPELNRRLRETCMVRRLKADVLKDLPEKSRVKIIVEGLGRNQDADAIKNECILALQKSRGDLQRAKDEMRRDRVKMSGMIFKIYSTIGVMKAPAAAEWAVDNSSIEQPLVIFAHHKIVLDTICAELSKNEITWGRIDGSTSLDARQRAVENFQAGKLQAIVLSITAASTGLTLTRSSDMLMVELPFGPGLAAQAEDRIHRIGQKNAACIRYLIAERTLDENLWGLINKKSSIMHSALDGSAMSAFEASEESNGSGYWALVDEILETIWGTYAAARTSGAIARPGVSAGTHADASALPHS